jgi:hypothetical protein
MKFIKELFPTPVFPIKIILFLEEFLFYCLFFHYVQMLPAIFISILSNILVIWA